MPTRPSHTARTLVLLFAAGVFGIAVPLLLGVALYRLVAWLTGGGR